MLIDPILANYEIDERTRNIILETVSIDHYDDYVKLLRGYKLEDGIYQSFPFNFHLCLPNFGRDIIDCFPLLYHADYVIPYGFAKDLEQLKNHDLFKFISNHKSRKFFISVGTLYKSEFDCFWNDKNGEYIGNETRDEILNMNEMLSFHIYETF